MANLFLPSEASKLAGITTGATANDTDANLKARANHTGTQLAATVSDFSTASDARITAANKKTDSMTTNKLLGRGTALTGAIEEITLGTNLSLSGTTLNAVAGSGTTFTPLSTLLVAASTASAAEKASANYVCDGTADEVEINAALTASSTKGGTVLLGAGTFNLAATISIVGTNFADSPAVALVGAGADATTLAPASGIHAITLTSTPKPTIKSLRLNLSGASDGIKCIAPTTGANDRRGFWMGCFEDLKIQGDFSTHSGWAINMESPFRSTFKRIQALGVKNGIWVKSSYSAFNPGNLTFDDCHMDLAIANGTAYFLDTANDGGFFNICTFIECDAIDSNGSSTTSIGWRFKGSTTTYYTTRDVLILRSNVENFNTGVSLEHSANIEFNGNYMDGKAGGTLFSVTADSPNNQLSVQYAYVPSPKTVKVLNDLNVEPLKPTTLQRSFARVETGGTLTMTKSVATVMQGLYRDTDGTGVYPAEWQGQPMGLVRVTPLTDGATITPAASIETGTVTLAGNRTMAAPTGTAVDGQKIMFRIKQDATGSRTITWNAIYRFAGATAPTLTTTASKTDYLGFQYSSADTKWDLIAERLGF